MIDHDDTTEDIEDYVLCEQCLVAFQSSGERAIPLSELAAELDLRD